MAYLKGPQFCGLHYKVLEEKINRDINKFTFKSYVQRTDMAIELD